MNLDYDCEHEVTEWQEDEETLVVHEVCLDCGTALLMYDPFIEVRESDGVEVLV